MKGKAVRTKKDLENLQRKFFPLGSVQIDPESDELIIRTCLTVDSAGRLESVAQDDDADHIPATSGKIQPDWNDSP